MNHGDNFKYEEEQCVLSPELIQLLHWICQYEQEALKHLIARALIQGIKNQKQNPIHMPSASETQETFLNFIELLELLFDEVISERALKHALQLNLLPALDQIDTSVCDNSTIRNCLAIATSKMERNPEANPKELLLKELLKRWNPENKKMQH